MSEYLIRPEGRANWIPVHVDDMQRVLTPSGWNAMTIAGWGYHRIRVADVEVGFSAEDVGCQVSVEGDLDATTAESLVAAVAGQLAEYSAEPTI